MYKHILHTNTMPRDIQALVEEHRLQGMPQLTKSPEDGAPPANPIDDFDDREDERKVLRQLGHNDRRNELHPYVQTLSIGDIESCIKLEDASFPPQEVRCTVSAIPLHS